MPRKITLYFTLFLLSFLLAAVGCKTESPQPATSCGIPLRNIFQAVAAGTVDDLRFFIEQGAEVLKILREFPGTVTREELRRAQEQAAAGMVMGLESNAARASRAACSVLLYNDLTPVEQSIAAYRNVTLDEMRAFAKELLDPAKLALCVLGKCTKKAEREMRGMVGGML